MSHSFHINLHSILLTAITLLIATALTSSCDRNTMRRDQGIIWNTTYNITYESGRPMSDSIARVLNEVTASLSVFDSTSVVSRVNRADSMRVNKDFINVYNVARKVNALSQGMYDPTISPLIDAWGFGRGHKVTADTTRIDSILLFCGIAKTCLMGDMLVKDDPRVAFNLSSIAKGYGCDRVAEMMRRNGIENFLIEIGGEIMAGGTKRGADFWTISVDKPIDGGDNVVHQSQCLVALSNSGLATSGNYRNYHREGGSSFGHIISPVTGRPVATDVLSATVAARTAAEADALATALMAMGSEKAIMMVNSRKIPAMMVLCDSSVWMSETFRLLVDMAEGKRHDRDTGLPVI